MENEKEKLQNFSKKEFIYFKHTLEGNYASAVGISKKTKHIACGLSYDKTLEIYSWIPTLKDSKRKLIF